MHRERVHGIDRADLEPVLRRIVARHFGKTARLESWHRRVSPYASSCILTRIKLETAGGGAVQVAFKDLTSGSQLPTARRVRPQFLYDSNREVATYGRVLSRLHLDTARYYGAEVAPALPRCWLFLEWVKGPLLWQLGRMQHWQQAACWLAAFHSKVSVLPDLKRILQTVQPLQYDRQAYTRWLLRTESILRDTLLRRDREAAKRFGSIVQRYDGVIDQLCALPHTLVHGEFYPANIVMRWTGETHRVCPIDWELTGWGPGVLDLAALSAGQWRPPDKCRIIQAYHGAAKEHSANVPALEDLKRSVACAQLHLCFRQLGWAAGWHPQGQQARAWLADALTLATQLGL